MHSEAVKIYHENGSLKFISNFLNGNPVGHSKIYNQSGKLEHIGRHLYSPEDGSRVAGKHLGIFFFSNGQLKCIGDMKGNSKHGPTKIFAQNGFLSEDCQFVDNKRHDRNAHLYYKNGKLAFVGNLARDKKEGFCLMFQENGYWNTCKYENGVECPNGLTLKVSKQFFLQPLN